MPRLTCRLLLVSVLFSSVGMSSAPLEAQAPCQECRIELRPETRIGASDDPFGLASGDGGRVAIADDGSVWVSPMLAPHTLAKYDAAGNLAHFVDRKGRGPGEYQYILGIAISGQGQLAVMSSDRLSEHELSAGAYLQSKAIPIQGMDFLPLANSSVVVNGSSYLSDRAGYTLHLVDPSGEITHSFGYVTRGVELDPEGTTLVLAPAPEDAFWAARVNQYRLDKWSPEGAHIRTIKREVDWFEPWDRWVSPADGTPPSRIAGAWEDGAGNLWVLHVVADEDHDPDTYVHIRSDEIQGPVDPAFDTIIEVLDANTGQLLASRRFPTRMQGFMNGRVIGFDLAADGGQQLVIYRPEIVRDP